jgi:hypothetical protein
VLTDEEIAENAKTLRADPRFDPGFRQIVDFRELTEIHVSGAGVRDVAHVNPFRRDARRAFIVTSEEAFGLTRMFGLYTDSSEDEFAIFRTLEPALEWIGLDPRTRWPDRSPDATFGVS